MIRLRPKYPNHIWSIDFVHNKLSNGRPYKMLTVPVSVEPINIFPGSPWENGYNERFNGTLRHEVLNREWFTSIQQAQIVINHWLRQYNHIRPHHACGMRAPVPETLVDKPQIQGTDIAS